MVKIMGREFVPISQRLRRRASSLVSVIESQLREDETLMIDQKPSCMSEGTRLSDRYSVYAYIRGTDPEVRVPRILGVIDVIRGQKSRRILNYVFYGPIYEKN